MTRIREEEEVVHWARLLRRIQPGLFDMALKNLGFFRFCKKPKKPKKSEFRFFLGFLKIKT